jgi:hypothetical protein
VSSSGMLKRPPRKKCDSHAAHVFNGLQSSKTAVRPCAAYHAAEKRLCSSLLVPKNKRMPNGPPSGRQREQCRWERVPDLLRPVVASRRNKGSGTQGLRQSRTGFSRRKHVCRR